MKTKKWKKFASRIVPIAPCEYCQELCEADIFDCEEKWCQTPHVIYLCWKCRPKKPWEHPPERVKHFCSVCKYVLLYADSINIHLNSVNGKAYCSNHLPKEKK